MPKLRFVQTCLLISTAMLGAGGLVGPALAQSDPGPRTGAPGAGGALPNLTLDASNFFTAAQARFQEFDTVPTGLGPRFNLDSCAGCHAQPAVGGSSPASNPQFSNFGSSSNTIPSFITATGPVREARFVNLIGSNGKPTPNNPDGGVHDLFVISGRSDAPANCHIAQPDFATNLADNNVIFRIPTPVFGAGLVENVSDAGLQTTVANNATLIASLGISPQFNRSGNDGTITRFGWKAQNKSLLIFAGEAYNVEQGVTNEAFPNERETDPNCATNPTPEDATPLAGQPSPSKSVASDFSSDIVNFAGFARLSAAPTQATAGYTTSSTTVSADSIARGSTAFANVGCAACHALTQTTVLSDFSDLNNATFQPLSDFAVHGMGKGLADGVSQGNAAGNQFRSAPLWGIGQRLFFLHDGRTSDLMAAIQAHSSPQSEANTVIRNFNALSPSSQQDLLNYLRSL